MSARSIIFDCDPGDDDAIALLMAIASPNKLNILGITTTSGNVPHEMTFKNARNLCSLVGREDIRVFKGSDRPLKKEPYYPHFFHGESGLDGYDFSESKAPQEQQHSVDFIVETILNHPEKVTLAVTGPMTNIARSYMKEPSIKDNIDKIVILSGARKEKGNITPVAEFNAWTDPHALQLILDNFNNVVMIGLDISHQIIITHEELKKYNSVDLEVAHAFHGIVGHTIQSDMDLFELPGRAIHDGCVTAFLLHPEYFSGRMCRIDVECNSKMTLGQTVVNWLAFHNEKYEPNCLFISDVDHKKVLKLIWEKVSSYKDTSTTIQVTN